MKPPSVQNMSYVRDFHESRMVGMRAVMAGILALPTDDQHLFQLD